MTKQPQRNEGIIISGGELKAQQVSVGRGARAVQTIHNAATQQDETVATALKELTESIQQYLNDQSKQDETLEMLASLAEEMKKETPNKTISSSLLKGLEDSVGHITSIAVKLAPFVVAAKATLGIP